MAVMRVLVVEAEVRMAALLRRGLSEEGYAVDVAGDGPEAVWRPTEFSYDAVVLDVLLPGLDGFEVCRRLRAGGCWVPVVMLTWQRCRRRWHLDYHMMAAVPELGSGGLIAQVRPAAATAASIR